MKIAVIGLGEIGGMLVSQMIERCGAVQEELSLYDRNVCKCNALQQQYPGLHVAPGAAEAVRGVRYVFLCVQPPNIPAMLREIRPVLREETNLFVSSSNVSLAEAEASTGGKVSKFLPTVNSAIGRGVIYAAHGHKVTSEDAVFFKSIMSELCSRFYEIEEEHFALLNNLAGCAPAFFAYFCQCLCQAAYSMQSAFSYRDLEEIMAETLAATGQRIQEKGLTFEEVITGVGKPGGITQAALSALADVLPSETEELMRRSVQRHQEMDQLVSERFQEGDSQGKERIHK